MVDEVVGLYGTRERVFTWRVGTLTVNASSDGVWLRGGMSVMSADEVASLREALLHAQTASDDMQQKRSA